MLKPDFEKYTLALIEEDKIIFSSQRHGLQPLIDCLTNNNKKKNLVLHDKVIGLAAAKLIVYAAIISSISTTLISEPAKNFLIENGIKFFAEKVVKNILTRDRISVCPGEIIAMNTKEPDAFSRKIMTMLSNI
jgi:hypothetical protein